MQNPNMLLNPTSKHERSKIQTAPIESPKSERPQSKIPKSKRPRTKIQNPNGLFGFWFRILDGYVETAFHESQTGRSLEEPNLTLLLRINASMIEMTILTILYAS